VALFTWHASKTPAPAWWIEQGLTPGRWRGAFQIVAVVWVLALIHEAGVSVFRRPYDDFWIANEEADGRLEVCSLPVAWRAVVNWLGTSVAVALPACFAWGLLLLGISQLLGGPPPSLSSGIPFMLLMYVVPCLGAGLCSTAMLFNNANKLQYLRMVVPDGTNQSWREDVPRWVAEEEQRAQARRDAEQRARAQAEFERQEQEQQARERLAHERERIRAELERTEAERRARAQAEFEQQEQERHARERLARERERIRAELRRTEAERRARAEAQDRRRKEEEARAREQARRRQEEEESRSKRDAVGQAFVFLGLEPTVSFQEVQNRFRRRALELHPDRNQARVKWANDEMVTLNLHMDTLRRFFAEESRAREQARRGQEDDESRSKREAVAQAFAFLGLEPTVSFLEVHRQFLRRVRELRAAKKSAGVEWFTNEMRTLRLHKDTLKRFYWENARHGATRPSG
jgi:hypothetical protein